MKTTAYPHWPGWFISLDGTSMIHGYPHFGFSTGFQKGERWSRVVLRASANWMLPTVLLTLNAVRYAGFRTQAPELPGLILFVFLGVCLAVVVRWFFPKKKV